MRIYKKFFSVFLSFILVLGLFTGCGSHSGDESRKTQEKDAPMISGLSFDQQVKLDYATGFQIYRYDGGYSLITEESGSKYLVVPKGKNVPKDLTSDIVVLQQPLNQIYMAATATASLFDSIDGIDAIGASCAEADGWYVEHMKEKMQQGKISFAGKYSQPDYELLVDKKCSLAVESTMILHAPEVKEKLEEVGIPVFVDYSSYEEHPLGRVEWVKVYGELLGKQQEAEDFFNQQKKMVEQLKSEESTKKTVAFFYCNQAGVIVTRKTSDYLPKMITLAGGTYIFDNLGEDGKASSSVNMTMEEFYATAKDADYIIYNGSIDNPLQSVDDLLNKNALFADFKAVKEGNVFCTDKYLYQATNQIAGICADINEMLTNEKAEKLTFLYRVH